MNSTWQFYDYGGRLNYALALTLWAAALKEADDRGTGYMGRSRVWSKTLLGERAQLSVIQLQGMTWGMMREAAAGAAVVNGGMMEYHFRVFREGREWAMARGSMVMIEKGGGNESLSKRA
ncbi:MAG: hypothetical protein LQ338_001200 [Usnochroma carphineum]|nr:MAG: hypothetical protein LQ338_001200 [Usnochroma carphineum]